MEPHVENLFKDGTIQQVNNEKNNVSIKITKHVDYKLKVYNGKKLIKQLLSSEEGFIHIKWSRNGQYFSVLNITYVGDWVYDGDLYIFQMSNENVKQILLEKDTGAGAIGFSNNNKYIAYGLNNKLILYEINTKKKIVITIPTEDFGSISSAAWNEKDNQIFIFYVISNSPKYYLISL